MYKRKISLSYVIIIAVPLVTAILMIGYALRDEMVYFYSPGEIVLRDLEPQQRVRLGGMVVRGSIVRPNSLEVVFVLTDGSADVRVVTNAVLPDLFAEGHGAVVEGYMVDRNTIRANVVLAKHDETYMARYKFEHPKHVYSTD